jgi:hypothetical protein
MPVASTWISIWRGWVTNFSMNIRSSPKLLAASFFDAWKPSRTSLLVPRDAHPLAAAAREALSITG